jgi:hypothetical protein
MLRPAALHDRRAACNEHSASVIPSLRGISLPLCANEGREMLHLWFSMTNDRHPSLVSRSTHHLR